MRKLLAGKRTITIPKSRPSASVRRIRDENERTDGRTRNKGRRRRRFDNCIIGEFVITPRRPGRNWKLKRAISSHLCARAFRSLHFFFSGASETLSRDQRTEKRFRITILPVGAASSETSTPSTRGGANSGKFWNNGSITVGVTKSPRPSVSFAEFRRGHYSRELDVPQGNYARRFAIIVLQSRGSRVSCRWVTGSRMEKFRSFNLPI